VTISTTVNIKQSYSRIPACLKYWLIYVAKMHRIQTWLGSVMGRAQVLELGAPHFPPTQAGSGPSDSDGPDTA